MGFCFCESIKAIVYQLVENGSLYSFIHDVRLNKYLHRIHLSLLHQKSQACLGWDTRSAILSETCCGLAYLHSADPPVIHQDIKTLVIYACLYVQLHYWGHTHTYIE